MPEIEDSWRFALQELRAYITDYRATDIDPFWQRKSKKAVLSVVVCHARGGGFIAYRGMNTEVSLPAGSFCAERAAIAQAASAFQRAAEILVVATADPDEKLNPLWPCEVCQSWLSKLRPQSPSIAVMAVSTSACDAFFVRVNGALQPPPSPAPALLPLPPPSPPGVTPWLECIQLAEGCNEMPWEARELVYADGAFHYLHGGHQNLLRLAKSRGTHLLVGVHNDEVLEKELGEPVFEPYPTRLGRILQNRYVDSVLCGAPWAITHDMIASLGIRRVITGSIGKPQDVGKRGGDAESDDPYRAARECGILEVVPSTDEITEREMHERCLASRAAKF